MRLLILLLVAIIFCSCERILNIDFTGNGNVQVDERSVALLIEPIPVTRVVLESNFVLLISSAETPSLQVEADANLQPYIITEVERGVLTLRTAANVNLVSQRLPVVKLNTPHVREVYIVEPGELRIENFQQQSFTLDVSARAKIKGSSLTVDDFFFITQSSGRSHITGTFGTLRINQTGSGEVTLTGDANHSYILQEGSGVIEASRLSTLSSVIRLFGSGLVYSSVTETLDARVSGTGRIYYRGNAIVSSTISGGGAIIKKE